LSKAPNQEIQQSTIPTIDNIDFIEVDWTDQVKRQFVVIDGPTLAFAPENVPGYLSVRVSSSPPYLKFTTQISTVFSIPVT